MSQLRLLTSELVLLLLISSLGTPCEDNNRRAALQRPIGFILFGYSSNLSIASHDTSHAHVSLFWYKQSQ